jgi:hypothetical protein
LIVLRSFNSLSEKRRSWSADVPLKKPERKRMRKKEEEKGKGELASVCHGCEVAKAKVNVDAAPKAEKAERHLTVSSTISIQYSILKMYFNSHFYPSYLPSFSPCHSLGTPLVFSPRRLHYPVTAQAVPRGSAVPP